jgi:hypothetical protein
MAPAMSTSGVPSAGSTFDLSQPVSQPDDPVFESKTLRAFVKDGRLVRIPARERKKRVILRWLLEEVLPDEVAVEERELNMRIALRNSDPASLRRYLVDTGLASRSGMTYRRAIPVKPAS